MSSSPTGRGRASVGLRQNWSASTFSDPENRPFSPQVFVDAQLLGPVIRREREKAITKAERNGAKNIAGSVDDVDIDIDKLLTVVDHGMKELKTMSVNVDQRLSYLVDEQRQACADFRSCWLQSTNGTGQAYGDLKALEKKVARVTGTARYIGDKLSVLDRQRQRGHELLSLIKYFMEFMQFSFTDHLEAVGIAADVAAQDAAYDRCEMDLQGTEHISDLFKLHSSNGQLNPDRLKAAVVIADLKEITKNMKDVSRVQKAVTGIRHVSRLIERSIYDKFNKATHNDNLEEMRTLVKTLTRCFKPNHCFRYYIEHNTMFKDMSILDKDASLLHPKSAAPPGYIPPLSDLVTATTRLYARIESDILGEYNIVVKIFPKKPEQYQDTVMKMLVQRVYGSRLNSFLMRMMSLLETGIAQRRAALQTEKDKAKALLEGTDETVKSDKSDVVGSSKEPQIEPLDPAEETEFLAVCLGALVTAYDATVALSDKLMTTYNLLDLDLRVQCEDLFAEYKRSYGEKEMLFLSNSIKLQLREARELVMQQWDEAFPTANKSELFSSFKDMVGIGDGGINPSLDERTYIQLNCGRGVINLALSSVTRAARLADEETKADLIVNIVWVVTSEVGTYLHEGLDLALKKMRLVSDNNLEFFFFDVVTQVNMIAQHLRKRVVATVDPLLSRLPVHSERVTGILDSFISQLEKKIERGLKDAVMTISKGFAECLSGQKKSDWRPEEDGTVPDALLGVTKRVSMSLACQRATNFVTTQLNYITQSMQGHNRANLIGVVGVHIFSHLCKHMTKYRVSEAAYEKVVCDLDAYQEMLSLFSIEALQEGARRLRELSNLWFVKVENLPAVMSHGRLANVSWEDKIAWIKMRADYNKGVQEILKKAHPVIEK